MTIDRKAQLETRRSEMAQEEQRMIFMLEEMGVEVDELQRQVQKETEYD
jgi:hypothetical protein